MYDLATNLKTIPTALAGEKKSEIVRTATVIAEVILVAVGFRLLDQVSYHFSVWLGLLPEKPAVTIKLVFLLSTISTATMTMVLIGLQRLRRRSLGDLGLSIDKLPRGKEIALIFFGALLFQVVMGQLVEPSLESMFDVPKSLPIVPNLSALLLGYAVSFVGGGFREELFFRGYLTIRLQNITVLPSRTAFWFALIVQVALFGLSHWYQGPAGVIGTTILGLGFTTVLLLTGSLWSAILFHGFFDVFGFTSIYLSQ